MTAGTMMMTNKKKNSHPPVLDEVDIEINSFFNGKLIKYDGLNYKVGGEKESRRKKKKKISA